MAMYGWIKFDKIPMFGRTSKHLRSGQEVVEHHTRGFEVAAGNEASAAAAHQNDGSAAMQGLKGIGAQVLDAGAMSAISAQIWNGAKYYRRW